MNQPVDEAEADRITVSGRSRLIFGSGEMADLTRAFDWKSTPVGGIEQWTDTLRITVNTLLGSHHPMFLWWGEQLIQFYNDGYRPSIREDKHPRALGQPGGECWPEIWPIIGPQIEAVMQRGEASWHEDQLVPIFRNGRIEDVYWTYGYSPVRDPEGRIRGTLVVCTETTQMVLARKQLQRERERLAELFEQAPAFFAVLGGPDFIFEMANRKYEELVGRPVLGKTLQEAIPEAESQGFHKLLDEVCRTGVPFIGHNTPVHLQRKESGGLERRDLNFVYQPRREPDGTVSGIIVLGVDVTEERRAEDALRQAEKLAVTGRLASSIAHEINNPLEAVTNLLYLAHAAAVHPQTIDYLDSAELELRRVAAIVNQTLRFHRQSTNPRPVTARELISNTLSLYQARMNNFGIALRRRERAFREIECLDGEIRQVLSNLIVNAMDAMNAKGGVLLVRSREATHWPTGRHGIALTVADNGAGISRTVLPSIFDPFFTTKGANGTGLGLWISREIVQRHNGSLRVRSRDSGAATGTVFTLFLPFDPHPVH